ncbi:hypothetical protein [Synechococcus sp. MU1617]|uniref:hypothetical protein n=1 Tax=Synechococcus sp. MU1617 TaxID=2508346 RepID=UPI001CF907CB|nr:hypothetical protein [Synechococcus sp. MU1617]MCB4388321.1 hypothetical protein [Synechococcus sp. MU1617]
MVIDLLALGQTRLAREKLLFRSETSPEDSALAEKQKQLSMYIDWHLQKNKLEVDLKESQSMLSHHFEKSCQPEWRASLGIECFSDYILISNGSIKLSQKDVAIIKEMRAPIFIFLNDANPSFQKILLQQGLHKIPHLLIAGSNCLVDNSLRLIYKTHNIYNFNLLACFIRNCSVSHFQSFVEPVIKKNKDVAFHCLDEVTLCVNKFYAEHSFWSDQGKYSAPSLGFLVIELFTALRKYSKTLNAQNHTTPQTVWLVGFDLSPSYVFEMTRNNKVHDFVYEYIALKTRYLNGSVRRLGSQGRGKPKRTSNLKRLTNNKMKRLN